MTVTVLNGTETEGLAHRTAASLQRDGYSQATPLGGKPTAPANPPSVEYAPGQRTDAEEVARALSVRTVQPLEESVSALADSAAGRGDHGRRLGRHRPIAGFLDIPERSVKPRERGITHVIDRGMSVAEVDSLLEVSCAIVDLVKLGWGTAMVSPNLEAEARALRLRRSAGGARAGP